MNLNATLIAQLVVFFILAWFTMKFVWPPILKALDERAQKIADGLARAPAVAKVDARRGGLSWQDWALTFWLFFVFYGRFLAFLLFFDYQPSLWPSFRLLLVFCNLCHQEVDH